MKKTISNIICLIASGVCFFFVITGINSMVYNFAQRNTYVEQVDKYKKQVSSSSYGSSYLEKYVKEYEEEAGKYMRNAFSAMLLSMAGACGIVLAVLQISGKRIFNVFGWVAAGVTTAAGIAYMISAIIAISDKEVYQFSLLPTGEKSPFNVMLILFSVLYVLILAAQFIAVFFSKDDGNSPVFAAAPAPAPVAPVAPIAPQPAAPVAPAPTAPAEQPTIDPNVPNLG